MSVATPNANGNYPEFDNAYWEHQAPAVRVLRTFNIAAWAGMYHASVLAESLASQGFLIDVPIMVWQQEPGKVMAQRIKYGYTWVPAATMPNTAVAPGVTEPGVAPYDPTTIPAGAIKVSLDFSDYPAYTG